MNATMGHVRRVVTRTLAELPHPIKRALDRCGASIEIFDEPPPDIEPDTFGTMSGGTFYDMESPMIFASEPPRIELYLSTFAELEEDPEEFDEEVRLTVIHEIGHFLGLEEDELEGV